MMNKIISLSLLATFSLLSACSESVQDEIYILQAEDISFTDVINNTLQAKVSEPLKVNIRTVSDNRISYQWSYNGEVVSTQKECGYKFTQAGEYELKLYITQDNIVLNYTFNVVVTFNEIESPSQNATAYITQVFDFLPAVGQFTNTLPEYEEGDTQERMNAKVLEAIGNNNKGMISLGGFGGYVVVGFDHTIQNVKGKRDFRVIANSFYANANPDANAPEGGSCEAGVIQVAYDVNKNGKPDDEEWYEIAGSSHIDPTAEPWYQKALNAGNNVKTYFNYEITYYRPSAEPASKDEWGTYIKWEDNQGNTGYKVKNIYHKQPYYPQWVNHDKITFKGTCLPQNGIDESGQGNYYVLYKYIFGYADNETNLKDESAIDIDWAVNARGQKVHLPGVDFIKIYTGVNQENGWLGECSTEITGIEDLHILGESIKTRD